MIDVPGVYGVAHNSVFSPIDKAILCVILVISLRLTLRLRRPGVRPCDKPRFSSSAFPSHSHGVTSRSDVFTSQKYFVSP